MSHCYRVDQSHQRKMENQDDSQKRMVEMGLVTLQSCFER